jgi:hypothetical protein
VTITLPDAGKRFMSLMIVNEDHYVPFVAYDSKPHTLTEQNVGTRYVMVAARTLVDPNDPKTLMRPISFRMRSRSARKILAIWNCQIGIKLA